MAELLCADEVDGPVEAPSEHFLALIRLPKKPILGSFYAARIAGSMILDLKFQKVMHGLQRIGVLGRDPHHRSSLCRRESIGNRIVLLLHHWDTWGDGIV